MNCHSPSRASRGALIFRAVPRQSGSFSVKIGALAHRNFRLFIAGQFVSLCGTWMQSVALSWLVLELTDSTLKTGLVTTLNALPVLLFTLYGGVVAARVN